MAGTSMNDIKSRIKSVSSTMQITKAMELVATSKLRRAKERLERSRPFYETLGAAIDRIQASGELGETVWALGNSSERTLYIVIAGDRGLAGGYNSNVFRTAEQKKEGAALYLPIGKKAHEYYKHRGANIFSDAYVYVDDVSVGGCIAIAESVCRGFSEGEFSSAVLVYTRFDSMLVQIPMSESLLPLKSTQCDTENAYCESFDPLFDSDPVTMLDKIVPQYVGGVIYSAVCESITSELGARRTAMESANKNAGEIIDTLRLEFNRARQAVITQEITEIVSGSEAL